MVFSQEGRGRHRRRDRRGRQAPRCAHAGSGDAERKGPVWTCTLAIATAFP